MLFPMCNSSPQQPPSLLCSAYLYYLCTFFILHAQCLCMLFTVPRFCSSGCSLPLHFFSASLAQASKRKNCISLLSIPHLLLISEFYLTLLLTLLLNFPFLTVQLIFHSEQPTFHSHCMFPFYPIPPIQLHLESPRKRISN
jgi:hypothetical protein